MPTGACGQVVRKNQGLGEVLIFRDAKLHLIFFKILINKYLQILIELIKEC